jgi:hypothetical protein
MKQNKNGLKINVTTAQTQTLFIGGSGGLALGNLNELSGGLGDGARAIDDLLRIAGGVEQRVGGALDFARRRGERCRCRLRRNARA